MANSSDNQLSEINKCIDTWSQKMTTMNDFQHLNNSISLNLGKINTQTSDIERLVQKLGTPEDSEQLRTRYLHLQNETKSLIQETNHILQQLQRVSTGTVAEQRQRKGLVETLSKNYLTTLNRFQEVQRLGARKEKESLERARAVSYRQQSIYDPQNTDTSVPSNTSGQQQISASIEQQVDINDLRERGEQLRQLETNITEINSLYKDVAQLVQTHGGIIDAIDHHIIEAETNVGTANDDLIKALGHQTAARRKKIILILIVIIVIIIVALGLYFGLRKS